MNSSYTHPWRFDPPGSRFASAALVAILALMTGFAADGRAAEIVSVNIFGDGDPANGIEDDRHQLLSGRQGARGLSDQRMNAGTIKCDGKTRGTGMVVDTRVVAPRLRGAVIASAAHVLYDLQEQRLFKRCDFHFMGLDQLPGYRAKIDMKTLRQGGFNPADPITGSGFGEGDWVFLHVPQPWRSFNRNEALPLADYALMQSDSFRRDGEIRLIAYDARARVISTSHNCSVVESTGGDLGGGAWKGQLLDDCDSADGASGGGLIAVLGEAHYLVGIRNGAHWDEQVYPVSDFPSGPPDGSLWDLSANTNFGRAIDSMVLNEFTDFIAEITKTQDQL
jgi:hypothetical protein